MLVSRHIQEIVGSEARRFAGNHGLIGLIGFQELDDTPIDRRLRPDRLDLSALPPHVDGRCGRLRPAGHGRTVTFSDAYTKGDRQ